MHASRVARVAENLRRMNLKQALISAPASLFYLTGKWITPGERMVALYINDQGDTRLYANRLFALRGNIDAELIEYDDTQDCVRILADGLQSGPIGIDKLWPSHFTIRLMEARGDIRPVVGSRCVDDARMHKDAQELQWMRESSHKNDQATMQAIARLHTGMSENEAAALHTGFANQLGSSRPSFEPLVCFGPNCAEPHHDTGADILKDGNSVILDVGLTWQDYCSDMTRTVFMGHASDEQKRVYDLVCAANAAGRAAVHPGAALRDIDHAARIDRAPRPERLDRLLVQKFLHAALSVGHEHAVVRARLGRSLDGNAGRLAALQVDLQGVEQQQHVAAHDEHAAGNAARHNSRGHAELVEQRRRPPVGKRPRHPREQLAARRELRRALAVAAGMQHQNALACERPLSALAPRDFAQHVQRRAAAAHALAARIGDPLFNVK